MNDEDKKMEIGGVLEEHSITDILDVFLEDNCYGEIVDYLVHHLNKRLAKLNKIEELMKQDE